MSKPEIVSSSAFVPPECVSGNHPLKVILIGGAEQDGWQVVWCPQCGAVAVDATVDGRVAPGRVMKMLVPAISGGG